MIKTKMFTQMATSKDKMNYWEINLENNLDWVLNLLSNWDNNEKFENELFTMKLKLNHF